jgi:hypothetical protein
MEPLPAQRDAAVENFLDGTRIEACDVPAAPHLAAHFENGRDVPGGLGAALLNFNGAREGLVELVDQLIEFLAGVLVVDERLQHEDFDRIIVLRFPRFARAVNNRSVSAGDLARGFVRTVGRHGLMWADRAARSRPLQAAGNREDSAATMPAAASSDDGE